MAKDQRPLCTTATARLKQDYIRLMKDPVPFVAASPLPTNILVWHYVVTGPEATPYEGGLYHGKLVFPAQFPFKPPSIYMITPSGRFKTNTRLCLSISDFHPDTWNPAWTVSSILTGLVSFMVETTPTLGSIESTDREKRAYAAQSFEFNLKDDIFCKLFPETADFVREQVSLEKLKSDAKTDDDERVDSESVGDDDDLPPLIPLANNNNNNDIEAAAEVERVKIDRENCGNKTEKIEPAVGFIGGYAQNICVFLGVAAFAVTIKCVLSFAR